MAQSMLQFLNSQTHWESPDISKSASGNLGMLQIRQKNEKWASGISTFTINSYPLARIKATYQIEENSTDTITLKKVARICAICFELLKPGETSRTLKCTHFFHKNCIDEWLKLRGECPLDRISMI